MEIKAQDVKKLREKTGAGMLDCKKALQEADGDFDKAAKHLKELGLAAAAKRSGRATNEGRVFTKITEKRAIALELACETDFVARNSDFIKLGNKLIDTILENNLDSVNDELNQIVTDTVSVIKENISISRFRIMDLSADETAVDYIHGEGAIGVIVKLKSDDPAALGQEEVKNFAFDTALHIAAFNPLYLSMDKVDETYRKEQEELFAKQVETMDKPDKVKEGIIQGKLKKHLAEICLLEQGFVKEEKKSVKKVMEEVGKSAGASLTISDYIYFRVGDA
ncbi:MAG: translation elongation factor Ts [Spirochaetales bacterium]|nr:translation elongation factor Ts [Spirochaetales bacterium]MCF7937476.1 translation elongation factor Ts [Spirochaetales bacterium]